MPKPIHEQMDMKGLELLVDEVTITGAGGLNVAALSGVANLTGTVGTANDAMTAVAAATAPADNTATGLASLTSVNTAITAINNNLADLQAKVNAILTALK